MNAKHWKMACSLMIFVHAILLTFCFPSQANAQQKVSQQDINDYFYAIGVVQTEGVENYISGRLGIDLQFKQYFLQGLKEFVSKNKYGDTPVLGTSARKAYDGGYQMGADIVESLKRIEFQLFGEECNENNRITHLRQYANGFVDGLQGNARYTHAKAEEQSEMIMKRIQAEIAEQKYGGYKASGERFLAENKVKPGVQTLPSGVQYKVIKAGTGRKPSATSKVKVHYEMKTYDGVKVDSSYDRGESAEFKLEQVIKGWRIAMENMPVGSVWEIYIPQELAYGYMQTGKIKPFSVLISKIEFLAIIE